MVTFDVSATDLVDGAVAPDCIPATGSIFPLGDTTVNCTATDAHHNEAEGSFTVTVVDTTPPVLTLPGNLTAEATSALGAAVSYTASANDVVDGVVTPVCVLTSGSTFPLDIATVVECTATDARGNKAEGSFTVTVVDTTPPVLALPGDLSVAAENAAGAVVNFTASATDLVDPAPVVVCSPASGGIFPIGETTVSCTATDAHNQSATGSFKVKVLYGGAGTLCAGAPGHAILQPIDSDGGSVFKKGSTVPAKFRVCYREGVPAGDMGVVSNFRLIQKINGTQSDVDETVVSTTPDTAFRWSASDQLWIFNLNTKNLAAGLTYVYQITLKDGSVIEFRFGLK